MQTTTYDAAGRRVAFRDRWRMSASASEETETQFVFDGDGRPVVERHGSRTISTPTPPPMVVATTGYQVWSSVLGSSLTSVNTSGEKVETKVFAGGTHIATQYEMNPATTSDDSLTFITADPVTGSVANYSSSGASADIEETEPLGQTVETFDPGSGYPTSYEDIRGIARDPEWQCRVAELKRSTFNEMPIHCKKAALADKNFSLPAALAESDPKRVPVLVDSPLPRLENSARPSLSGSMLVAALVATEKRNEALTVTDWVLVNGEVLFDSRVLDEASAEAIYGPDAIYYPLNYSYTASTGAKIVLLANGQFTEDGVPFSTQDRANATQSEPVRERILQGETTKLSESDQLRIAQNPIDFVRNGRITDTSNSMVRMPDYVVACGASFTTGICATADASGGLYLSLNLVPQNPIGDDSSVRSFMRLGGNISMGWLNQLSAPSGAQTRTFLTGPTINVSCGSPRLLGGGMIYSPGNGTATEIGAYSPGCGVVGSGAFEASRNGFRWR